MTTDTDTITVEFPDGDERVHRANAAAEIILLSRQRGWRSIRVTYREQGISPNSIPAAATSLVVTPYDAPGECAAIG